MKNFTQLVDGVGVTIRSKQRLKFICCDCGLTHDMVLVSHDGKSIGLAVQRNKQATSAKRRSNKFRKWIYSLSQKYLK